MPKQPTKPTMPAVGVPSEEVDLGSARHASRPCAPARAALAKVDTLAARFDSHVEASSEQMSGLSDDVRKLSSHVGDLRVDAARMQSTMDGISSQLAEDKQVRRAQTLAEIDDGNDRRKARRAFWTKVAIVLVGFFGGGIGALIKSCQ